LARAIADYDKQLHENHALLDKLVERVAPGLRDTPQHRAGDGGHHLLRLLPPRQNPIRIGLRRPAPQQASSGNTVRHRLNRGGDRQLNRAFDIIVKTRLSFDPNTRTYSERARTQGKSPRKFRRNLKRYVCRAVFRQLQSAMVTA
jgi:transposase